MGKRVNFGDLPAFRPAHPAKVLAAVSFLIQEAEKLEPQPTQYEIVESIFKA